MILSAKYGVKARDAGDATAWAAAEVTVAVAALIGRGRLFISSGVRKSRILGFWDPDPAEEKVLQVQRNLNHVSYPKVLLADKFMRAPSRS